MNVVVGELRSNPLPTSNASTHAIPSVLDASREGSDLFGQEDRIELCRYCRKPLSGKQIFFDSAECRSAWHHLYEDALAEKVRRDRVPDAIAFVEANPDILVKIPEWIKEDLAAGIRARWKYYLELYWRWRWSMGKPISLQDHHEKTVKNLVLNRHPEYREIFRMRRR